MKQKWIEEIRARCNAAPPRPWIDDGYRVRLETPGKGVSRYGRVLMEYKHLKDGDWRAGEFAAHARQDVPDLLDALEKAQAENERLRGNDTDWAGEAIRDVEAVEAKYGIELVSITYCEQLHDNFQAEHAENLRLREALRKVEQKCRKLVGTKTADHHIAVLDECRMCGAQFSSMTAKSDQPHRDDCPFKLLEGTSDDAENWNWCKTCRKCGVMYRQINGVWVGKHSKKCPTLKGGDST